MHLVEIIEPWREVAFMVFHLFFKIISSEEVKLLLILFEHVEVRKLGLVANGGSKTQMAEQMVGELLSIV